MPIEPTSPGGQSGAAANYNLYNMDQLVNMCKQRGIRLSKDDYNKFRIIAMLKEDDRNPQKGGLLCTLLRRMCMM